MNLIDGSNGKMNLKRATKTHNRMFERKTRMSFRILANVLSFCLVFQSASPAFAAISSAVINDLSIYVDNTPSISTDPYADYGYHYLSSGSYNYKFETEPYIVESAPDATNIESFIDIIKRDNPYYINLNSTTNIIVGTPIVQSRYIRSQIQHLLGRSLIDVTDSESSTETKQINTLYSNALEYLKTHPEITFGQNLGLNPLNTGLTHDMVWPEIHSRYRYLNGSLYLENIIVPVVYLSQQTLLDRAVKTNRTELYSTVYLGSLNLENSSIALGRDAFLNVAEDLINSRSVISGEGDLNILAGGNLVNMSGLIQSEGDLSIGAHNIFNQTLVYRYAYDNGRGEKQLFGQIAAINSVDGSVTLRSHNDIVFQGADANASGDLTLIADGSIYLGSQQIVDTYEASGQYTSGTESTSTVSYLQSNLTASQTIQLLAAGNILIDAAQIVSDNGHIELLAGMGITVEDDLQEYQSHRTGTFGSTSFEESVYKTVAIRALLDAGKGIRIHSELGDITLRAADIRSQEGTSVNAKNGAVNLLITTETDHYSYSSVNKDLFTTETVQKGHNIETGVPNTVVGGFAVEAFKSIAIEYEGNSQLTLDQQINNLSQMEGLSWMANVRSNTQDVDWSAIELQYETWNISNTSLSPAAIAVISVAVAIAAGPAGAAAASGMGVAATSAVGAAISAGSVALISQGTIAFANGAVNGDISGAMEDLASSETFKSLVVAMITAGALAELNAEFFDVPASGELNSLYVDANTLSLTGQATQAVTNSTVQAGVSTLAYGGDLGEFGDSFSVALMQSSIDTIGEVMATEIGLSFKKTDGINNGVRYIAHAATGCVIGAASAKVNDSQTSSSNNCASGAGGAVVGEFIGDIYKASSPHADDIAELETWMADRGLISEADFNSLTDAERLELQRHIASTGMSTAEIQRFREIGIDTAKMGAALTAFIAGADVEIAAATAENAAENNALPAYLVYLWVAANTTLTVIDVYDKIEGVAELAEDLDAAKDDPLLQQQIIEDFIKDAAIDLSIDVVATLTGTKLLEKIIEHGRNKGDISKEVIDELEKLNDSYEGGPEYEPDIDIQGSRVYGDIKIDTNTRTVPIKRVPESVPLDGKQVDALLDIKRVDPDALPEPDTYLSADYITEHLAKFDEGVVRIQPNLDYPDIGMPGEATFVMPRSIADQVIVESNGNPRIIESMLGLAKDSLGDTPVRIDISSHSGLKIPKGNELGARYNDSWVPGGYTTGNIPEAVIDSVPAGSYTASNIIKL